MPVTGFPRSPLVLLFAYCWLTGEVGGSLQLPRGLYIPLLISHIIAAPSLCFSALNFDRRSHEVHKLPKCMTVFSVPQIMVNFKYIFF